MAEPPAHLHYANGVLRNRFGISDRGELGRNEALYVTARQIELANGSVVLPAEFGWERLKATHRHLFQDVYDWAGQPRTWDIAKVNPDGSLVHFLDGASVEEYATALFDRIRDDDYLVDFGDETPGTLAAIYNRLNVIHPFPEGNGRTNRAFIRDLGEERGYPVDFEPMDTGELLSATINAARGDINELVLLFEAGADRAQTAAGSSSRPALTDAQSQYRTAFPVPLDLSGSETSGTNASHSPPAESVQRLRRPGSGRSR